MITRVYAERLKKNLLRLSVFSLITVIIWLIMATYHSLTRSKISPDVKKNLTPLTASLPLDTINEINQRLKTPEIDWSLVDQANLVVAEPAGSPAAKLNEP